MKKWIIALSVISIIAIGGWVYAFYLNSTYQATINNLNGTNTALMTVMNGKMVEATQASISSSAEIQKKSDEINSINSSLATEKAAKETYQTQVITLNQSLEETKKSVMCDNAPEKEWDYSSNTVIVEQLKSFIGDTVGSVYKSDWAVIWDNSKATIQNLYTGEFKEVFIVYLPDERNNPRIYYLNYQCYLDY